MTPAAQAIGAVNTIRVEADGQLSGDNTDAPGFVADLRDHGVDPAGQRVIVLGAGGSACAVVYGLAAAGASEVIILNRTAEKATGLAMQMQAIFPRVAISTRALGGDLTRLAARTELIVNTTSLGMTPHPEGSPWPSEVALRPGQVIYDLVYNPPLTRLLQQATAAGATAIGGLGMLIWQGAIAFERWTGQPAPVPIMRQTVEEIFARR